MSLTKRVPILGIIVIEQILCSFDSSEIFHLNLFSHLLIYHISSLFLFFEFESLGSESWLQKANKQIFYVFLVILLSLKPNFLMQLQTLK
jgi:hypothetical protein